MMGMECSFRRTAAASWGFFVTLAATITVEGKMSCRNEMHTECQESRFQFAAAPEDAVFEAANQGCI